MTRDDLTALRAALGYTSWAAFASRLGVSHATVYRWLNGAAPVPGPVRVLVRLAKSGIQLKEDVT